MTDQTKLLKDNVFLLYMGVTLLSALTVALAYDNAVWVMETAPAFIGLFFILSLIAKGVHLPGFLNVVFIVHIFVLVIGGIYSYPKVPFFNPDDFLGQTLGWSRNNYDKLGHFMQGFTPYLACRQLLVVRGVTQKGGFSAFLAISVSLAVSAAYELIEYGTIFYSVEGADDFVGAQGDPFDTQKDILWALIGALSAWVLWYRHKWRADSK